MIWEQLIPKALLVYGGTYENCNFGGWGILSKTCYILLGKKEPEKRAAELYAYCSTHLRPEQRYDDWEQKTRKKFEKPPGVTSTERL